MKPINKFTLIFIVFLNVSNFKSQETKTSNFSLQQAIEFAIKNNPNQLNAELDLKNAEYKKNEIVGIGLPQINSSIDFKNYISIPTSLLPAQIFGGAAGEFRAVQFGTKYNSTAGISASQLIFSSDYIFGLKASEQFLNLSRIAINRSQAELISQVSKAYYTVLINNERIKLLEANIVRLKKILDDTRQFNQQGFVELIDVERLEVQFNNLSSEKDKILRLINLVENLLKFQMGYKISNSLILTDTLNCNEIQFEDFSASKIDISKRPDFQILKAQQILLGIDLKRQKWSYLPTLVGYASHNYNAQRQTFNLFSFDDNDINKKWFQISLIGATLNLNIFNGLQRVNRLKQAEIALLKGINTLKIVETASELEVSSAIIAYNNAYTSLLIQAKNKSLAKHIQEVVQKKYQAGVGNNLEIVNAETSLKEAETNYYNSFYDMLIAKIDYQKAMGLLTK